MATGRENWGAWQRAAVLGSLWASVEIVVGSFLHNLNVPFAGSALAAFGVVVMTAGHRASPVKGVIWRAALICALMKSVSPSAVILGPMVGILMEGVLLEAAVRLAGANAAGYVIGGALAATWPLFQKILSALIAFGPDVVRLYVAAFDFASKSLGMTRFGPVDLVATLFVVECLVGASAAVAGLHVARRGRGAYAGRVEARSAGGPRGDAFHPQVTWSLPRLAAFSGGLVAGMSLLGFLPLPAAAACVVAYAALVLRAYPRALARLRRPMFWAQGIGVVLLAGLLLGGVRGGTAGLLRGLEAGCLMVLRAVLVVFGFTAVSVELRNPRILSWLERRKFRGLSDALGLAFGALPAFTQALADQRMFWRHPIGALANMLQAANSLYRTHDSRGGRTVILTGETGAGKTTRAVEVVDALRARGLKVAGVLAKGLLAESRRSGFDIVDLATGRTAALCREGHAVGGEEQRWGRFSFTREGLALGREALAVESSQADVVIVDEVGPLELAGGGWADAMDELLSRFDGLLIVVARHAVVEAVKARWGDTSSPVCEIDRDGADRIAGMVVDRLAPGPALDGQRAPA